MKFVYVIELGVAVCFFLCSCEGKKESSLNNEQLIRDAFIYFYDNQLELIGHDEADKVRIFVKNDLFSLIKVPSSEGVEIIPFHSVNYPKIDEKDLVFLSGKVVVRSNVYVEFESATNGIYAVSFLEENKKLKPVKVRIHTVP